MKDSQESDCAQASGKAAACAHLIKDNVCSISSECTAHSSSDDEANIPYTAKLSDDSLSDAASAIYDYQSGGDESNTQHHRFEAQTILSSHQVMFGIYIISFIALFALYCPASALITLIILCNIAFLCSACFKLWIILCNDNKVEHLQEAIELGDELPDELPQYSILLPLFKESLIIPQLITNISSIIYPKEKLQVLLIIENDDVETLNSIQNVELPQYFSVIRVPYSEPRTKAKACNYAMRFVTGQYTCIYDAEDKPDSDQLLKVLSAFSSNDDNCACVQARLNFYNAGENILTMMFSLEYRFVFDYMLPVLQKFGHPMPLGGSSNHFRTHILKSIMWDPYNLTEDADLGMQLKKRGHSIVVVDSYTMEEAPIHFNGWYKQRSRWIKGYIQTYLVYSRHYSSIAQYLGLGGIFSFYCIFILGNFSLLTGSLLTVFLLVIDIAPQITILLTISAAMWYIISFIQGFVMAQRTLYSSCHKIIHGIIFPIYIACQLFPCVRAILQLITKPYYWEKTTHGLSKLKI